MDPDDFIVTTDSSSNEEVSLNDTDDIIEASMIQEGTSFATPQLDASNFEDDDFLFRKKCSTRNQVFISSDSETDSDQSSISDEEDCSRNITHMISHSESVLILSSDEENEIGDNPIGIMKHQDGTVPFRLIEKDIETNIENISFDGSQSVSENRLDNKDEITTQITDETENSLTRENMALLTEDDNENLKIVASLESELPVTPAEHNQQSEKVALLKKTLSSLKISAATVNLNNLKDNGERLIERKDMINKRLEEETIKLNRMKVTAVPKVGTSTATTSATTSATPTWEELQRDIALVQPHTFGKRALKTVDNQRVMTMDGLRNLHSSLEERPAENVLADTPPHCKVQLMEHQKHALAFMMWREMKQPSGGLLADDMGLGKTLTVISLCLATLLETQKCQKSTDWKLHEKPIRPAGVLVVCPASVLGQWVHEVKTRVQRNTLDVLEYHGTNRHQDAFLLRRVDIVLTTYATLTREYANNTDVYKVKWRRVVLDEAHQVRNHKTQASQAVCALRAQSRWALTGTPIHNQEIDMYGLLKYLHCEPFDDLAVWKRWVGTKATGGNQRLQSALQALMLRRTKADMIESGSLCIFPERVLETIKIKMDRDELLVYNKLMVFSRTLFAQFLHQKGEKHGFLENPKQFDKVRRDFLNTNQFKEVKQSQILVLLLRLRQICIHPALIIKMLETTDIETMVTEESLPEQDRMYDVLDQLSKLKLHGDNDNANDNQATAEQLTLTDAVKTVFDKRHPVFDCTRKSSKIRACLDLLKERIFPTGNKAIVVSQWTSFLKIIAEHLKADGIPYCCLDGSVKIEGRQDIIDQLNSSDNTCKIMLLSLTAGGVGLNLIGANHLLILDPHWNPQLELQAQDRIYRIGQKKKVHVYRLLATDSIEERIIQLQEKKLEVANAMLTGGKIISGNKLTFNDLKMLFNM